MEAYDAIASVHDLAGDLLDEWPLFRSGEYPGICGTLAEEMVTELVEVDRAAEWGAAWAELFGEEDGG